MQLRFMFLNVFFVFHVSLLILRLCFINDIVLFTD